MKPIAKGIMIVMVVFWCTASLPGLFFARTADPGGGGNIIYLPIVNKSIAPAPLPQGGNQWFVSPNGRSSGNGSESNPWDLQTVLNQPSTVKPGDTIWLLGGRYNAPFKSHLKGMSGAPIVVRAYPGQRATLDGTGPMLTISDSSWVYFWGFEITKSNNSRPVSSNTSPEHGILISSASTSSNIKFINLVIHDLPGHGVAWWRTNTDSEIYGSLVYNNGVMQYDHGVYSQNESGVKRLTNNIIFDNAAFGIHIYSSGSAAIDNYMIAGNTLFNNGSIGRTASSGQYGNHFPELLIGGDTAITHNPEINDNHTYASAANASAFDLGYAAGSSNAKVINNYFMNGMVALAGSQPGLNFTGNTIFGSLNGFSSSSYPGNTYLSGKPSGLRYFVQPNIYEPGRANLVIYNWSRASTVNIPAAALSGVQLRAGEGYELHNAVDFYGDVITGTYDGSSLPLPMTGRSVAAAVGIPFAPPNTFPEFGVFILINRGREGG
ncbi:MAG TPA: right-handed parallel beta-helix repeat-containing protein [Anaerolineaceae bacterium]|nr:right-handed parallel beta-helix repeat-containing protein [Anaerolineaceae bacterium]